MDTVQPPQRRRALGGPSPGMRRRILDAAVESLIEQGVSRTTTLEVQRRAKVSRGALLHHFPTLAQLLSATIDELVGRNEQAVLLALATLHGTPDRVELAIRALAVATTQGAYLAELELWAVARTDAELRAALVTAERRAHKESERVLQTLFSGSSDAKTQISVVAMTMELLRGLALTSMLRGSPARRQQLVTQWIEVARRLLAQRGGRRS